MSRTCFLILPLLLLAAPAGLSQDKAAKPQATKNLIANSTFEHALGADGLPLRWNQWIQAGGKYRSEVVEGGRTGKKCLKIEGEGIRAAVFANPIDVDRNKRYGLRGWVKFEGDKDARANIVFNYFHEGKWLGLPDQMGVTGKQKGWRLLAKTDRADNVPAALEIQISCNIEGKGTAWFSELELIAFDKDNLPADFETRYLSPEFSVLARRIGTWDTQTTIKPGVWVPDGAKTKGVETIDWALGKKFIQG
jgi:hypothetical protein